MEPQYNFFDANHPLKPYAYSVPRGQEYTVELVPLPLEEGDTEQRYEEIRHPVIPPDNSILASPRLDDYGHPLLGEWPIANDTLDGWDYTEDHRQRKDERDRIIEGTGTPYWLPGDAWNSQARYMEDIGPLPEGALLEASEKPLETLKEEKLAEIRISFDNEEAQGYVVSSLGFRADATRKSKADIDGLIQAMEAMGMGEISFRDYDNQMHVLNLAGIKTLQLEVIQKGLWNYQVKWDLEAAVTAATTKEEVEAIVWPGTVT